MPVEPDTVHVSIDPPGDGPEYRLHLDLAEPHDGKSTGHRASDVPVCPDDGPDLGSDRPLIDLAGGVVDAGGVLRCSRSEERRVGKERRMQRGEESGKE